MVAAHRLSTIRDWDLIAVVEEGRVVEKGIHSSLLAKGPKGTYSGLVAFQHSSTSTADAIHPDQLISSEDQMIMYFSLKKENDNVI